VWRWARRLILLAIAASCVAIALAWIEVQSYPVSDLARSAPKRTALMREREKEAIAHGKRASIDQRWVSYSRISPTLRRAVLVAEDDAFFSHDGLDWNEIKASARKNLEQKRVVRGGSTITRSSRRTSISARIARRRARSRRCCWRGGSSRRSPSSASSSCI
jgi:monofunctional biosynthetic peptidoglycan transglycosylase